MTAKPDFRQLLAEQLRPQTKARATLELGRDLQGSTISLATAIRAIAAVYELGHQAGQIHQKKAA